MQLVTLILKLAGVVVDLIALTCVINRLLKSLDKTLELIERLVKRLKRLGNSLKREKGRKTAAPRKGSR